MKKFAFGAIFIMALAPVLVFANGAIFPDYEGTVYLPNQKTAISWDGQQEIMILATKVQPGGLTDMAWVIPIPSQTKPVIEQGEADIFYDLSDLFASKQRESSLFFSENARPDVNVIEIKKIDIYDIAVLKATNAQSLVNWLNKNNYPVSEESVPVLQAYCDKSDFYFVVNKINISNKYPGLAINEKEKFCADMLVEYYEPLHRRAIQDIEEEEIERALENIEGCHGINPSAAKAMVELGLGIATPLKIAFEPRQPFYPLFISSINEGQTTVHAYVFSLTPMADKNNVLSVSEMIKMDDSIKSDFYHNYGLKGDYITFLSYSGGLKDLKADALFKATDYDSGLDPTHVSFTDNVLNVLSIVLAPVFGVIAIFVPFCVCIFAGIGFFVVCKKILEKIKK